MLKENISVNSYKSIILGVNGAAECPVCGLHLPGVWKDRNSNPDILLQPQCLPTIPQIYRVRIYLLSLCWCSNLSLFSLCEEMDTWTCLDLGTPKQEKFVSTKVDFIDFSAQGRSCERSFSLCPVLKHSVCVRPHNVHLRGTSASTFKYNCNKTTLHPPGWIKAQDKSYNEGIALVKDYPVQT